MSSLLRKMETNRGTTGPGRKLGFKDPECPCCAAKELREQKRAAKAQGGHVL